ncbi:cell division protein ZapC [Enterobacterales bacterium CwR94]|nr:cell division protein ZapC [Enterobacterales bacterium CwR94]
MKIKPDDSWHWYFDTDHDRMMLDLADGMLFRSRFSRRMLTPDAFQANGFCVDDAAFFFNMDEKCRLLALESHLRAELVLNALVARRFLKPLMPKSWHFTSHGQAFVPSEGDGVQVQLCDSGEIATLVVVESGESAALCLLAQNQLLLAGKTMILGEAIKVMNDRLYPLPVQQTARFDQAV